MDIIVEQDQVEVKLREGDKRDLFREKTNEEQIQGIGVKG
jgi:hypothetical protein